MPRPLRLLFFCVKKAKPPGVKRVERSNHPYTKTMISVILLCDPRQWFKGRRWCVYRFVPVFPRNCWLVSHWRLIFWRLESLTGADSAMRANSDIQSLLGPMYHCNGPLRWLANGVFRCKNQWATALSIAVEFLSRWWNPSVPCLGNLTGPDYYDPAKIRFTTGRRKKMPGTKNCNCDWLIQVGFFRA